MPKRLTARSTLDTLKKEAKRRLKLMRAADPDVPLRAAQQAVARDYGFDDWISLKAALADLALSRLTPQSRADAFLRHCDWGGDIAGAERILIRHPETAGNDLLSAIVCGDLGEVRRRLAANPEAARRKSGPLEREPLLYLAYGRFDSANAVAIAELLLDLGADPNARFNDGWENAFTVLCGVIGLGEGVRPPHPQADALAELLFARGASPFDFQALYNDSVVSDNEHWLDVLWRASQVRGGDPRWKEVSIKIGGRYPMSPLDYLLGNAARHGHHRRVQWLVAHGADPNGVNAYTGLPHHTQALAQGDEATASLLERLGARPQAAEGVLALMIAAMRLDAAEARRLVEQDPALLQDPHPMLGAAERGRADVVGLLLDIGASPELADGHGARPLHRAAQSGSIETARRLIEAGADVDVRGTHYDGSALSFAVYTGQPAMAAYLAPLSGDAAPLVGGGFLERLEQVLAAEPERANLMRRNGRTPLYALPDDEALAAEAVRILLKHGADPRVQDPDGVTPAAAARQRGLDEAAELMDAAS